MTLAYSACGLCIGADQPLPGLLPDNAGRSPDIRVWLGDRPDWARAMLPRPWRTWYSGPVAPGSTRPVLEVLSLAHEEGFRFRYADGIEFLVDRSEGRIWADWRQGMSFDDAAAHLVGPILGFLQRLAGCTVLHASSVVVDKQAIALFGPSGAGKSTTAAALAARGYPVLTDDLCVVREEKGEHLVVPAFPRLRLWADSGSMLYGPDVALPRLTPNWDKRYLDLSLRAYQFLQEPQPLAVVYLLDGYTDDDRAPFLESCTPQERFVALVANTYPRYPASRAMRIRELDPLARLAEAVPVKRIISHEDPIYLSTLCNLILSDLETTLELIPSEEVERVR